MLLAVTQHEVHVLVKRHERAHQDAGVLDGHAHARVDEVQQLAALVQRLHEMNGAECNQYEFYHTNT